MTAPVRSSPGFGEDLPRAPSAPRAPRVRPQRQGPDWIERLRQQAVTRLWPAGVFFTAIAVAATTTQLPGVFVGDNRFDQFVSPGRRIAHSLVMWDGSRGFGRVREDLWPGQTLPLGLFRSLGASPWLAERLFHAMLLSVAAIGVVALVRVFRPRITSTHVLAGAAYAFGPYSATFLLPSNLYVAFAVAPWLLLSFLRGVRGPHPWRWAASFALWIFACGNADLPGVVYACLPLLPAAAWVVWVERSATWRGVLGWFLRAGVLTIGVDAAALFKTAAASAVFSQRLGDSESPDTVNLASSWSETLRGLGFWLSYFRGGGGLARPQGEVYFQTTPMVLLTFVPAVVAALALWLTRARERTMFAVMLVLSAAVMVGIYPYGESSPYGRLLLRAYDVLPSLSAFRTNYKAGAGLMLGVAVLFATGVAALRDRFNRWRPQAGLAVVACAAVVVLVGAVPFWRTGLYDRQKSVDSVPAYWSQAMDWLDSLPGDGRVLILPSSTRTQYRWGWVGDDIFDAFLRRNHAIDTSVPLSSPEAANLLNSVSEMVDSGSYVPGTIAPLARRLGFDRILIRNDVDWRATRTIRPGRLEALREDPDLVLEKSFGRPGEYTFDPGETEDPTASAIERRLPPVQIYSIRGGVDTGKHLQQNDVPLLLSGDGDAWPQLARDGFLDAEGPVRYTADLKPADAGRALSQGGRLVLSDTNRRRVVVLDGFHTDRSHTLAPGQDLDRKADDLFANPHSQTVAWFRDATSISVDGPVRGLRGAQPWARPAAAFDGNPATAWQTIEQFHQEGRTLRVDFKKPTRLSSAEINVMKAPQGTERIDRASLLFSDGSSVPVDLPADSAETTFAPRTVRWVEVRIDSVSDGVPSPVGFSDITFPGVDLREWIQLPDDVFRLGAGNAELARLVADAPTTYTFLRDRTSGVRPIEPSLLRRFRSAGSKDFTLSGLVRVSADQTDQLASSLAECGDASISIDGAPVPIRLFGNATSFRAGDPLPVVGCDTVHLDAGVHSLDTSAVPSLGEIMLNSDPVRAGERPEAPATQAARVQVLSSSPTGAHLRVDAPFGGVLLTGESFDPRWVATVDGRSLGPATSMDTMSAWEVPAGTALDVRLRYAAEPRYQVTLAVTAASVVLCLWLVIRRPGRRRGRQRAEPSTNSS